jgi:prolyl-tRNA synthetase
MGNKNNKKESQEGITVKKHDDMPEWYNQVVANAELADFYEVQGFMTIRPNGYAIWEKIQEYFNQRIKALGVKNAYFPLLIPESFFHKEAEHAEGFSPEVAWVENKGEGERLAIRPTSETVMYSMYSKWVRSHRDLPLRINQWCNVLRWEVSQTKLFLRSREFLWQEGHCVYTTEEECNKETQIILNEYKKLSEELLGIPVLTGPKTEKEKFPGALTTYTMEGFMPDGKALQMGTSHDLGQGFAKAFNIKYVGEDEKKHIPWQNSWGFSTRLIGGIIMTHGDDKGLVLPPKVAPIQFVIVPIIFKKGKEEVMAKVKQIANALKSYDVHVDDREGYSPGWKYNEWEMKGIPVRVEVGPKDVEKGQCVFVRRDTGEKVFVKDKDISKQAKEVLDQIQKNLLDSALKRRKESMVTVENWDDFNKAIKERKLVRAPICGEPECEDSIKEKTGGANSRCIDTSESIDKECIHCKKKAKNYIYFAKSY